MLLESRCSLWSHLTATRVAKPALEETRHLAVRAVTLLAHDVRCARTLRDEANAALLGHTVSLLLQTAEQEAAAGDRGCRSLRGDALHAVDEVLKQARASPNATVFLRFPAPALLTLRIIVCCTLRVQVDDADAVAFFLPGIASRLCKAVYQATIDAPSVRNIAAS